MFKSNKNPFVKFISVFVTLVFLVNFSLFVNAYTGNTPHDSNMMMEMSMLDSIELPFDPNDYNFLVYDPGLYESRIRQAMDNLGITYTLRDPDHPVTIYDLLAHDILIVGWNDDGSTNGLDANTLASGITGRVVLSGHDLDYHESYIPAARTMLIQAIGYVLKETRDSGAVEKVHAFRYKLYTYCK